MKISAKQHELEIAQQIARVAHSGQCRKFTGLPYVSHPEAVAKLVKGVNRKIVAWLHDVLEDNPQWTAEQLLARGISKRNVQTVVCLTKRIGESYCDFIVRIHENYAAVDVKIADITHNLSDLPPDQRCRRDKYELALQVLTTYDSGDY